MGTYRRRLVVGALASAVVFAGCAPVVRVSIDSAGDEGNDVSSTPSISADGTVVAFISTASDLVANDTNGVADIFVHDRTTGATIADGTEIVFPSDASNFADDDTNAVGDVFVRVNPQTPLTAPPS